MRGVFALPFVAGLILLVIGLGYTGIGLAAARDQCPDGQDCADALSSVWLGISAAGLSLMIVTLSLWGRARQRTRNA